MEYESRPQKSWFGRNWFWLVPLVLIVLGSPFICCGGAAFLGFNMVTQPRDGAIAAMEADPAISAKLGTPLTAGSTFNVTNYQNNNGNGSATLSFNVSGPNGNANVSGDMALTANVWRPADLTITCDDGTEFKLPAGAAQPEVDATEEDGL
ncbi:MAG: cytochrome c oxidase assembly factor Coa1 family protein [Pirellulaceae bacterium]|nr:hypothetical protein [Planctomycetales bacterium]